MPWQGHRASMTLATEKGRQPRERAQVALEDSDARCWVLEKKEEVTRGGSGIGGTWRWLQAREEGGGWCVLLSAGLRTRVKEGVVAL